LWWVERELGRAASLGGASEWGILLDLERRAKDAGLTEHVHKIRLRIQEIDPSKVLTRRCREIPMPAEYVHDLATITEQSTVPDAVESFLKLAIDFGGASSVAPPPAQGLDAMFESTQITPDGAAARVLPSQSDDPDSALRDEARRAKHHCETVLTESGFKAVPALNALIERFGGEFQTELMDRAAESKLIDQIRARHVVDAIGVWGQGSYDLAAHAIVPRIEYVIRQAAKAAQVVVIKSTDGTSRGGHTSLNQVLEALEGKVDEDSRLHLTWVLTSDLGLNLRNDIAHGGIIEVDEVKAAVLIHAFLLALTLTPQALHDEMAEQE